jgi:hypothetical protein
MSVDKHINLKYSGTTPYNLGDRYYSQDLIRDLLYGWDVAGQLARRLLSTYPALLYGGVVTKGADWAHIDITACYGVADYVVDIPDTFTSLPPSKTTAHMARMIYAPAQTAINLAGLTTPATLDGSTNYVKLQYTEADGNSRTRARAAGTYAYEQTPSYTYYCDTVAPGDHDVVLATLVGDGATYMTITAYTPYNLKKAYDDLDVIEKKHGVSNSAVATNTYTVSDTDNTNDIFCNASARAFSVNLPTLAANIGRIIRVKIITAGGKVSVTPEGAETIDNVNAAFEMYTQNDNCTLIGEATGWRVLSGRGRYQTGFVQTDTGSNRHFGTITVVTKTVNANLYTVGELITEETSGNTWRIDSITAGDPGAFVVRAISGTGLFTLNKKLTGSTSGVNTIQVSAATLDQDCNVIHGLNKGMQVIKVSALFSPDNVEATTFTADAIDTSASASGYSVLGIDTTSVLVQTGGAAAAYHGYAANGSWTSYGTTNSYYNILVEVVV